VEERKGVDLFSAMKNNLPFSRGVDARRERFFISAGRTGRGGGPTARVDLLSRLDATRFLDSSIERASV